MAWLLLLRLVRPAEAYVRQNEQTLRLRAKRGTVWAKGPGWAAFGPPGSKAPPGWVPPSRPFPERVQAGPSHWEDRAREVEGANRQAVEEGAEELLRSGATVIPTPFGPMQAKLVRFWNGTGILDCQFPSTENMNGRSFTLVGRRELKGNTPSGLAPHLLSSILSLDQNAHPDLWDAPPPERKRVPSPGEWLPLQACGRDGTGCRPAGPCLGWTSCRGGSVSGTTRRSSTGSLTLGCGGMVGGKCSRHQGRLDLDSRPKARGGGSVSCRGQKLRSPL